MSDLEGRYTLIPVQMRARGDKRTIGGYAAMFDKPSRNLGGFVEIVDPAFFNKSMGDGWPDVMARYNHDDNMLLGTTASGTLRLEIDKSGLIYDVDPPKAREDIIELVERGDVRKSSFAFRVFEDDWSTTDQGFPQRTLVSGQLVDVAPVNLPAYSDTSAALRSFGVTGLRSIYNDPTVALRRLAEKVEAEYEEVRKAADEDDLLKFFKRSDRPQPTPKPRTFGPAALMEIKRKEEESAA